MSRRNFREMLEGKWNQGKFLCGGLDSDLGEIPKSCQDGDVVATIFGFNRAIVNATYKTVCAYKLNAAFYEEHGDRGWAALSATVAHINKVAPDVPVILDAKRGDTKNTNIHYANMAFDYVRADAITVQPYLGGEPLEPFLKREDKGVIVLCRTSNPGASEFQDLIVRVEGEEAELLGKAGAIFGWTLHAGILTKLYAHVAYQIATEWNTRGNCGVVVGATYLRELRQVRGIVGDMPILIPAIGAQGGDLKKAVASGKDGRGKGMIINVSRSLIFSSSGHNFWVAAGKEATRLDGLIRQYL